MKLCIWQPGLRPCLTPHGNFKDAWGRFLKDNVFGQLTAAWPPYELREGACRVHLTPYEGLIMTALLGRREVTVELLMEVLWPDPDLMPDRWYEILVVQLSKLRGKLRRCGWTIAVRHGFGWRLAQLREERLAA